MKAKRTNKEAARRHATTKGANQPTEPKPVVEYFVPSTRPNAGPYIAAGMAVYNRNGDKLGIAVKEILDVSIPRKDIGTITLVCQLHSVDLERGRLVLVTSEPKDNE